VQAQVSGLTVDGNVVAAEVAAGSKPGEPCILTLTPQSDYLTLDPVCVTGAKDAEKPVVFRKRARNVVATTGPVPAGAKVSRCVTLEDPGLYVAALLRGMLVERRVRVDGECVRGRTAEDAETLASHTSKPLSEMLVAMNVSSDNNMAEALLRTIPLPAGKPGTAAEGGKIVAGVLEGIGVDVGPLRLCDGSGLSRLDLLTPRALVGMLQYVADEPKLRDVFVASLPVAGESGTMRRRMVDTPGAGVVRAKTGSLWGACALSGYIGAPDEGGITFSMLMNNYRCGGNDVRRLQDRACVILIEHMAQQGTQ